MILEKYLPDTVPTHSEKSRISDARKPHGLYKTRHYKDGLLLNFRGESLFNVQMQEITL